MENYRGINLVNECYKLYSKILNEKLKAQAESSFWVARMDSEKADHVSIQFSMKSVTEFNMETHFAFPEKVTKCGKL